MKQILTILLILLTACTVESTPVEQVPPKAMNTSTLKKLEKENLTPTPTPTPILEKSKVNQVKAKEEAKKSHNIIETPAIKPGTRSVEVSPFRPAVSKENAEKGIFDGWVGYDGVSRYSFCKYKESEAKFNPSIKNDKKTVEVICDFEDEDSLSCLTKWNIVGSYRGTNTYDVYDCRPAGDPLSPPRILDSSKSLISQITILKTF